MAINYFFSGSPLTGSANDDVLADIGQYNGGPNSIYAYGGDDLVMGDIGFHYELTSSTSNASIATAISLEIASIWSTDENPLVANSSIPHATAMVEATAGESEYFSVAVGAGQTLTVDIDFGSGSAIGTNVDTIVEIRDGSGTILASSDDSSVDLGGAGSASGLDSYLTFVAPTSGTYYINVRPFGGSTFAGGETFVLNTSVTNHSTFSAAPVGADTIYGGDGDDSLFGVAGNDYVSGDLGNDTLNGGSGDDTLYGGDGNDIVEGGAGNDLMQGNAGTDTASYAYAAAKVSVNLGVNTAQNTGGAGTDTLSGFENLTGSAFNDTLNGDGGNNLIDGRDGNDLIDGGLGDDVLYGGNGINTVSYGSATSAVTVDLNQLGTTQNTGGSGNDYLWLFQNVTGSNYNDVLTGDGNDNTLTGGNGNDTLVGGAGNDKLDGGTGVDTADYSATASAVTVNLLNHSVQNTVGAGNDQLVSIENVIGSAYDDTLTGNEFANALYGGDGNDILNGGLGNDTLDGGLGIDTASYATATGAVRVSLAIATAQSTISAGTDTLHGIENLTGGAYDDQLTGDANNNVLTGNAGNDTLVGGLGDDTLNGGAGLDMASYASAATAVTVNLSLAGAQATGGGGNDTLISIENVTGSAYGDVLTGSAQANSIYGGNGNDIIDAGSSNDTVDGGYGNDVIKGAGGDDVLIGGVGSDTITGGAGADTLTGGTQADTFVYLAVGDSAPATADRITDFAAGDILDLGAIDANTKIGGNQAFVQASAFTHAAGEFTVSYDAGTNTTTALFDTNGDANADMAILFTGNVTALTGSWVL
ncbi:calcium-binding protein [Flavisphingomonas formosensis]|uniref:calcium-binding protein n=1 Tax=Flavisphingomonas formosensis TaxID=861534 RepID=UPI0012F9C926|nr:calcium-binding protein [Sphingomonas formosensis]